MLHDFGLNFYYIILMIGCTPSVFKRNSFLKHAVATKYILEFIGNCIIGYRMGEML